MFGFIFCFYASRFGRKLAVIRGEVEREIQALVSKRDNAHTHHPYHAWDPVPSLSAASAGNTKSTTCFSLPTSAALHIYHSTQSALTLTLLTVEVNNIDHFTTGYRWKTHLVTHSTPRICCKHSGARHHKTTCTHPQSSREVC